MLQDEWIRYGCRLPKHQTTLAGYECRQSARVLVGRLWWPGEGCRISPKSTTVNMTQRSTRIAACLHRLIDVTGCQSCQVRKTRDWRVVGSVLTHCRGRKGAQAHCRFIDRVQDRQCRCSRGQDRVYRRDESCRLRRDIHKVCSAVSDESLGQGSARTYNPRM